MAISVIIGVFVGLAVGCASMAMWAVRRIVDKAMRQLDRGFECAHWLAIHDPPPPDRRSAQVGTWLEKTVTRPDRIVHDSGSMARVCCKEIANVR